MLNLNAPDPESSFQQELLAILEDPQVKKLAQRRAGDPDLARDALQQAYYAVSRVTNPAGIRDLRAYFCQVLIHEAYHLSGQLRATPADDPTGLADVRQTRADSSTAVPRPVFETVWTNLLAEKWLTSLADQCAELIAKVPGRSTDPGRYRAMIFAVAEQVVRMIIIGDVSDADRNATLLAAYPEWFAEPGCPENSSHQRFSRARADVRALLLKVISHDDLLPLARAMAPVFSYLRQ
jgi:DNA-directed RNA polymerase specialized sigma24 family protein